jgi:hypothetical protein
MRNGLVVWLLAAACALPSPVKMDGAAASANAAMLSVDRARYRSGDALVLTLRNGLAHAIGYNLCGAALEQRVGTEWRESPHRLAEVCTMELRTLAPGASGTYRHTVPGGASPGEYRVRSAVESPLGGSWTTIHSGTFTIGS